MADITARLIWYRLGEVADNVRLYIMDEDVDVLDILFGMWVLLAIFICMLVYGVEWLTKTSRSISKDMTHDDARRWSQLKRRHSFFNMDETRSTPSIPAEPPGQEVRATVVEAIQHEPLKTSQTNGSVGSATDQHVVTGTSSGTVTDASGSTFSGASRTTGLNGVDMTPHANCHWMNRLIMWMYLNYNRTPDWLESWLKSLNAELERKAKGEKVRLEFVSLTPGSLPPKIVSWSCEPDDDTRCLFIRTRVTVSEVGFAVRLVRQSGFSRAAGAETVCNVALRNFVGDMRIAADMGDNLEGIRVLVKFLSKPNMDVNITRPNSRSQQQQPIDFDWVKRNVVSALENSTTEITFAAPHLASRGDSRGVDAVLAAAVAGNASVRQSPRVTISEAPSRRAQETEETVLVASRSARVESAARPMSDGPIDKNEEKDKSEGVVIRSDRTSRQRPSSTQSSTIPRFYSGQRTFANRNTIPNGSVSRPLLLTSTTAPSSQASGGLQPGEVSPRAPSPMPSPITELAKGQSILTKVIKVAGLSGGSGSGHRITASKERGLYCVVEMNEPYQRHTTQVVRGSSSAFWDQSFVLELNCNSQRVTFAVFDNDSQKNASLGQTVVPIRELMAHPSSRQIIPLRVDTAPSKRRTSRERESSLGPQPSITVEFLFLLPEKPPSPSRLTTTQPVVPSHSPHLAAAPNSYNNSTVPVIKVMGEGDAKRPAYNSQTSTSSSSTSATSSSSASSAADGRAATTKEHAEPGRPPGVGRAMPGTAAKPRMAPHAIVITGDGQHAAVNSRDLAEFMSPPETIHRLSQNSERPPNSELTAASIQDRPPPLHHKDRQEFHKPPRRPPITQTGSPDAEDTGPSNNYPVEEICVPVDKESSVDGRGRSNKPGRSSDSKRSRSFASRLRRTFTPRGRSKERSQSADRLSNNSLRPPEAAHPPGVSPNSSQLSLQKSKSSGLSGSFRRIFGGGGKRHKGHQSMGSDYHTNVGGSGLVVSHSSPHLGPTRPPYLPDTSASKRPTSKQQQQKQQQRQPPRQQQQQQPAHHKKQQKQQPPPPDDDGSSYSSEGYLMYDGRDSYI